MSYRFYGLVNIIIYGYLIGVERSIVEKHSQLVLSNEFLKSSQNESNRISKVF